MKSLYIFAVLFCLLQFQVTSQLHEIQYIPCSTCNELTHDDPWYNGNHNYGTSTTFQTSHVSSDYGARNYNGYDWHGGVDYSPEGGYNDYGDAILAIRGGIIQNISQSGYKYIVINGNDINSDTVAYDFGYGHIFTSSDGNQRSGNFFWQKLLNVDESAIIFNNTALYTVPGRIVIHPISGDTLITTNSVSAYDPIAPMGSSADGGDLPVHLHLYMFENNDFRIGDEFTKNPLTHCVHDTPTYTLELFSQFQPLLPGLKFNYPGIDSSQILVKAIIDSVNPGHKYNEAVMNLEKTEIFVSSYNLQDTTILGFNFESSIRYDGTLNDTIYDRHPSNLHTRGEAENGRTGIKPRAYSGGAWDYFNYADFFTRIHKNDSIDQSRTYADLPAHTRYNDGPYEFKAVVTDVRGNEHVGPVDTNDQLQVIKDTLDNFMPFVESVSVEINNEEAYFSEAKSIDSNLTVVNDGYMNRVQKIVNKINGLQETREL